MRCSSSLLLSAIFGLYLVKSIPRVATFTVRAPQPGSNSVTTIAGHAPTSTGRERFFGAVALDPSTSAAQSKSGLPVMRRRAGKRGWQKFSPAVAPLFVRNIDLPEALIFYDTFDEADWSSLLRQCRECGTVAVVVESVRTSTTTETNVPGRSNGEVTLRVQGSVKPPNPKDLWNSLSAVTIQPRPFGGSSGFGASQVVEPARPPLPSRAVVIGPTEEHSRAARYAGMRAVSTDASDGLADAVLEVDEVRELWLEDIATPGSFWLNPPHPRDDKGNRVDPEQIISEVDGQGPADLKRLAAGREPLLDDPSGEDLDHILADLSPL